MSHVVHDVQQQYLKRQARHNMEGDTVYIVLDFTGPEKVGMLIMGKGMQWFGMGAYVKHGLDPGQCATAATAEDSDGVYSEQEDHVEGGREECEQCKENYYVNIELSSRP